MLRWIALAVIVVALTALATFLSLYIPETGVMPSHADHVVTGPQPRVEIAQPLIYDFGTMPQQTTGKHSWVVKNAGAGDLELWMESSTCSCTIAKLVSPEGEPKKTVVVKPGDSTTIDLEWQTKTFKDAYSKGATIGTNDMDRPAFQLNVKGTVYPPVLVYPPEMIRFDAISNEEPNSARIAVFSMDRPNMKITKLSTSRPELIIAKLSPLSDDDRKHLKVKSGGYKVDIEVKPGLPVGAFQDELVVDTDHPLQSQIKVSIAGRATGPINVVPLGLRMTDVPSRQGAQGDLLILVRGDRPTKFEVERKPDKVEVSIMPDATATQKGRYRLRITVPKGTPPGQIEEDLILRTDHPHATEIRVPINIFVSNIAG